MHVSADIIAALRRIGLLAPDETARGERLTGGVSSDIWRIDLAAGPVCVKRALAKLRVAADWQAPVERNRYEARWMQRANAAVPGAAPLLLGLDEAAGALAMQFLPPERYTLWKTQLRDGDADPAFAAAVADTLARIHAATAADPAVAADFPTDRDLLRHPPGALPARDRPRASRPGAGAGRPRRHHPGQQARAGARRRQPEEHPARARRPGVPRRRVRLVGRSGVRPRLLPQPPAAEVPVDAVRRRRLPRLLRRARRRLPRRRRLGSAARAGGPRGSPAARAVPRQGGWQVAGRVHHRRARQEPGAAHRTGAARRTRSRRLGDVRLAWTKELSA